MPWIRIEETLAEEKRKTLDAPEWLGFVLVVTVVAAGVLAMVVPVLLVDHSPAPVDDAIPIGLAGFLFVVILDFFLVCYLASSKIRQGQYIAALKWSVSLILLGLLAASAVGSLVWLGIRLIAAIPWVPDIPWGLLLMLWVGADILWRLWRRRHTRKAS
jgi:hypothetical protein